MTDLLRQLRTDNTEDGPLSTSAVPAVTPLSSAPQPEVPPLITRVLASPDRGELLEVARMLDQGSKQDRHIIFHTPIGDIKCRINWQSCEPEQLKGSENIFFVKMRSADVAFTPKSGAVFEIGFAGYARTFPMVCLAPPQQLYPGVDLMCFLPHNLAMEKTGKLADGSPSIVSGEPSNTTDKLGEPIVDGEKSASEDFDQIRAQQD